MLTMPLHQTRWCVRLPENVGTNASGGEDVDTDTGRKLKSWVKTSTNLQGTETGVR